MSYDAYADYQAGKVSVATADDKRLYKGDTFYAEFEVVANYPDSDYIYARGTVTDVEVDGDVSDEGTPYTWPTAYGVLADGRKVSINQWGDGHIYEGSRLIALCAALKEVK